ncbi:MAG: hypothetical protein II707_00130, partial [Spirochaetales bacterium]|nr:hypothetical protein [Spirochaetales bacterium]
NCKILNSFTVNATIPPTTLGLGYCLLATCSALTTIYVPADSVEAYKTANNWKDYADIIKAITE